MEKTLGIIGGIIAVGSLIGAFWVLPLLEACQSAKVYNQQNETDYTCADFLFTKSRTMILEEKDTSN